VSAPPAPAAGRGSLLDRTPPVGLVLAGVCSIQVGAAFATTLFDDLGATGTVFLRLLFAAAVLLAVWRPSLRATTPADLRLTVLFGLSLAAMNACFYEAIARIPLGVAVTLEFVGPLGVAVVGSRRPLDLLWAGLAAGGILLLSGGGRGDTDPVGIGLALLAGVFWACYILLAARAGQAFTGGRGLAIAMAVGALVLAGPGVAAAGSSLLSVELLAAGAVVAMASSVIPYSLETEALRRIPTRVFGVLMSLEPAVAALAGLAVLSQGLGAHEVAAIGLVITASAGVSLADRRAVPPDV
jgi:inner membrane transporter RhtA